MVRCSIFSSFSANYGVGVVFARSNGQDNMYGGQHMAAKQTHATKRNIKKAQAVRAKIPAFV
jgi:hypothetical protein